MTESTQETTVAHEVVVHKASITLAQGETLGHYMSALSNAARDAVKTKLKLPTVGGEVAEEYTSTYLVEAFSKAVILNVYRSGRNVKAADRNRYYQMKYVRDSGGSFSFTDMKEVVRRTTFEPVKLEVAKAATKEATWESVWKNVL